MSSSNSNNNDRGRVKDHNRRHQDAKNQDIYALLDLMKTLRDPAHGCPWDVKQTFETIAPYTIEEAYEVADAIERGDMADLKDELGDLLLQIVFHAQMAAERDLFDFQDVAAHVTAKMIHRHPHVFGSDNADNAEDVEARIWEERKAMEGRKQGLESILDDVPKTFPALPRAQKLQKRAARVGFEWPQAIDVFDKIEEEIAELRHAIAENDTVNIEEEIGDMMFCLVNLGRMLGVDCETSLRKANDKFELRFKGIEKEVKSQGKDMTHASLDEMELLWQSQKQKEKS